MTEEIKKPKNGIICKYKINKEKEIRIFGDKFVENNKKICKIVYNNQEQELVGTINITDFNNDFLEITLNGINNIVNASYMFYNCISLTSLENIDNWDTSKVTDMNNLFYNCRSLKSLPDISKWNTSNVTDMNSLFNNCESLISLPDISGWDTSNVTDMSFMFCGCNSLSSLPDISKWNTSNVTDVSRMFSGCTSLSSLIGILKMLIIWALHLCVVHL